MTVRINLGHDEDYGYRYFMLDKAPHMLVAGMTGSGKSVFTNAVITDLMNNYAPSQIAFVMIDPKRVELMPYRGGPHLVSDPVYRLEDARQLLWWSVGEMNIRYEAFAAAGVRDISSWDHQKRLFTRLLIVIDELASLILSDKAMERPIVEIATMGRAAGIHLLLATQRPSADVLTGLIRANVPTRICMPVLNSMESRIMLDSPGAEQLTRPGSMLARLPGERELTRIQGDFVSDEDIRNAVENAKKKWRNVD